MSSGELEGDLAPPMANGEVLFEAPWQGRVFGMARALCDAGLYTWDEFRVHLIREISAWDRNPETNDDYAYFDHFQRALEQLLQERGLVSGDGLEQQAQAFADRPHGHDH